MDRCIDRDHRQVEADLTSRALAAENEVGVGVGVSAAGEVPLPSSSSPPPSLATIPL